MGDFVKLSAANFGIMGLLPGMINKLLTPAIVQMTIAFKWRLTRIKVVFKMAINTYLVLADKLHHLTVQWAIHTLQQRNFFIPQYLLSSLTNFPICAILLIVKSSLYANKENLMIKGERIRRLFGCFSEMSRG